MITRIGHPAIRAKDMEETARFCREVLGVPEAFRMYTGPNGECTSIHMYAAPSQFIEIFPGGEEPCPMTDRSAGQVHMCYKVDDAAAMIEEFRGRGAVIDAELKTGFSRCIQFWTHDPDGSRIELMELPAGCMQQEANQRIAGVVRGRVNRAGFAAGREHSPQMAAVSQRLRFSGIGAFAFAAQLEKPGNSCYHKSAYSRRGGSGHVGNQRKEGIYGAAGDTGGSDWHLCLWTGAGVLQYQHQPAVQPGIHSAGSVHTEL